MCRIIEPNRFCIKVRAIKVLTPFLSTCLPVCHISTFLHPVLHLLIRLLVFLAVLVQQIKVLQHMQRCLIHFLLMHCLVNMFIIICGICVLDMLPMKCYLRCWLLQRFQYLMIPLVNCVILVFKAKCTGCHFPHFLSLVYFFLQNYILTFGAHQLL